MSTGKLVGELRVIDGSRLMPFEIVNKIKYIKIINNNNLCEYDIYLLNVIFILLTINISNYSKPYIILSIYFTITI